MSPARRADNGEGSSGELSLRAWLAEAEAGAAIILQLVHTPFIPDSLKRWHVDGNGKRTTLDLDASVATATAALLAGRELGFGPMASLRSFDVIGGVPAMRAIALRALVQTHGHDIWVHESTASRAIVRARRKGGELQQSVWTIERAKQLGLYPGNDRSPWRRQPTAQLVARATAEAARWVAADSILGMPYVAEELIDAEYELPAEQAAEEDTAQRKRATTTVKRRRGTAVAELPPGLSPVIVSTAEPAPAASAGGGDGGGEPPAPPAEQSRPRGRRANDEKLAVLSGLLREAGITSRADAHALVSGWVHRPIANARDLTDPEADTALKKLRQIIAAQARARQDNESEEPPPPPDEEPDGQGNGEEAGDAEPDDAA